MIHLLLILLIAASGCTAPRGVEVEEQVIAFTPATDALRAMKGGVVTSEHFHDDMGVTAFIHQDEWSGAASSRLYFDHLRVSRAGGFSSGYPWPADGVRRLSFFAYAPFDAASKSGATTISYQASKTEGKVDLVTASHRDVPSDFGQEVELHFHHPLTAISVVMSEKSIPTEIDRITLDGTAGEGTYDLAEGKWTSLEGIYSYQVSEAISHPGPGRPTPINAEPLFVLPAAAEGKVPQLLVYLTGESQPTVVPLKGAKFTPGSHLVLRLFREDPAKAITVEVLPWTLEEYRIGYISGSRIQLVKNPVDRTEDLIVTDRESRAHLTVQFLRPIGVEWRATLTNGMDFEFVPGTPRGGITDPERSVTLSVRPRYPQGRVERQTEIYLTVYGREIDPDRTLTENGEKGIGKGRRFVIRQPALK